MIKNILILAVIVLIGIGIYNAFKKNIEKTQDKSRATGEEYVTESVMRSRQTQVQTLLQGIYSKEAAFFAKNGYYTANTDSLQSFDRSKLEGNKYYSLEIVEATSYSFIVRGWGNIDNDDFLDEWQIDEKGHLEHLSDDISNY